MNKQYVFPVWIETDIITDCTVFVVDRDNGDLEWSWISDDKSGPVLKVATEGDIVEKYTRCNVQILTNTLTGEKSHGWYKTDFTEMSIL